MSTTKPSTPPILLEKRFQVRVAAAQNPETSSDILGLLAQDSVPEVRVAAAQNPKMPQEILNMLRAAGASRDLRHRFASPPDTTPDALSTLAFSPGPWGRALAAAHPKTPPQHIQKLLLDSELCVQLELLNNPALRAEDGAALVFSVYPEVRSALALWPHANQSALLALSRDPVESVRLQLTQRLKNPPDVWFSLVQNPSERTLRRVAAHPNAPQTLLLDLYARAPQTLPLLAQNPSTPQEILATLAQHPATGVRRAVAQNPKTPPEILLQLHRDDPVQVSAAILDNPLLNEGLINTIAAHERRVPRLLKLLQHPATSAKTLDILASHPAPRLRAAIAAHPKTSAKALVGFCTDPTPFVRVAAAQNPNTPPEHLSLLIRAGAHPKLSCLDVPDPTLAPERLSELAKNPGWARVLAAAHPKTPSEVLEMLATSKDYEPHLALAQNPNAPLRSLEQLACSPRESVRILVARHPHTPLPTLISLCEDPSVSVRLALASLVEPPFALLEALVRDANEAVLSCVAAHPKTPSSLLDALAQVSFSNPRAQRRVLARVAANPSCPLGLLEGLLRQGVHPKRPPQNPALDPCGAHAPLGSGVQASPCAKTAKA